MTELHNVIGSILRDIAQSRVTSDLYSREVSRYYEEDALLRLFPIPRTEIKEVEIDLNFGISEIKKDVTRTEDKQVYVSRIIQRYSEKITDEVFESLRGSSNSKIGKNSKWQALIDSLDSVNLRADLKFKITNYFETNKNLLIEEAAIEETEDKSSISLDLNKAEAENGLKAIVENLILNKPEVKQLIEVEELDGSISHFLSSGLGAQLDAMDKDLSFDLDAYAVGVSVSASDLAEMPENTISKIKIIAEIKNYNWSQVEEKDNKVVRRLIPE